MQTIGRVTAPCGRTWDPITTLHQIGAGNVAAISGGRSKIDANGNLILPVAAGYSVEIEYDVMDTYIVRRVFSRAGKTWVKGERTNVYADEIGEVAYAASCFRDEWEA